MNRRAGIVLVGAVLILLLVALIGACQGPQARTLPPPSSTSSTESTVITTAPDYSRIALEPVPGETTTTAPMAVGSSTLRGSVAGPDGPVPGAVVRADRLVGDAVQRVEVRTAEDGTYTIEKVPGGRFRVRAFLPPTLAMESAEVFFLEDGTDRELRLLVQAFTGLSVRSSTAPFAPFVGQDVNLAVRVAQFTVDDDGVAREVPQPDVLVRVTSSGWTRADDRSDDDDDRLSNPFDDDDEDDGVSGSDNVGRTGADGVAVFAFHCDRVTSVTATAFVGDEEHAFPLDPPPCRPRPTTTTTTTATTTTTTPDDDGGRERGTTTSTTER